MADFFVREYNTPEGVYLMYALDKIGAVCIGLSPLNNEYQMKRDIEMTKPKMVISVDALYKSIKSPLESMDISPILYSPVESLSNPILKTLYWGKQVFDGNTMHGVDHNLYKIVNSGKYSELPEYVIESNYISDIMFTGGSSGIHKGVELFGNGFNCLVKSLDEVFFLEPGQVHLGNVPINHMVFGKALTHYVLCNNLRYALTLKMTPNYFTEEVIRTKANGIMGGPIHFENLIDNPNIRQGCFSCVVQAVSGGEHFKAKKKTDAEKALRQGGSTAIIANAIGSTETSSVTHVNIIDCRNIKKLNGYPYNIDYEKTPVTCGGPIPGLKYKIVHPETYEDVTPGEPGLLLVSGPTIMKGYYNNPEETDRIFHFDQDGVKWFNTGDILYQTGINNGEIAFAGRKKRNFVCNVSNIYPEELEGLLLNLKEVREVVVTKIPDNKFQYLPSYHISLYNICDYKILKDKIKTLILGTFGEDALPGYISFTTKPLPRTDNGKLDSLTLEEGDLQLVKENKLKSVK